MKNSSIRIGNDNWKEKKEKRDDVSVKKRGRPRVVVVVIRTVNHDLDQKDIKRQYLGL
jgi:hypothetical protein